MSTALLAEEEKQQLKRSWSSEQPECEKTTKSPSICFQSIASTISLNSTDPGDESTGSSFKRRYSELSWAETLQTQELNTRLLAVYEELEQALPPVNLRNLKPKPCVLLLNTRKSSLRLKRGQTFN